MSYTAQDHQLDAEESCVDNHKALCWGCVEREVVWRSHLEHVEVLRALPGWTCLGCGAEIGEGYRRVHGDGCSTCLPLFKLIDGWLKTNV